MTCFKRSWVIVEGRGREVEDQGFVVKGYIRCKRRFGNSLELQYILLSMLAISYPESAILLVGERRALA